MGSSYPTSLDTLATTKADGTATLTDHAAHHNDLADAINKIEAELGTDPSGTAFATVKAAIAAMARRTELLSGYPMVAGRWYGQAGGSSTAVLASLSQRCTPMLIPNGGTQTISILGFEWTSGTTDANAKLIAGIYADSGFGFPVGDPLAQCEFPAGTFSATGTKNSAITFTAPSPGLYWIVYVHESTQSLTFRTTANYPVPISTGTLSAVTAPSIGYSKTVASYGLPTSANLGTAAGTWWTANATATVRFGWFAA